MADIFGSDTIETTDDTVITLDTLVGDDRKYKNADELAKAYAHADAALERLRAEKAQAEAEAKVLRDLEEARRNKVPNDPPHENRQPNRQEDQSVQQPPQKQNDVDISQLVRQELQTASEEDRKSKNINSAADTLTRQFGSAAKAQEAIRNRAQELGVGFEWLRDVAADSPNAFFAAMGINPNERSKGTPGYQNEVNINRSNSGVRDYTYWENLRKTSPKAYYLPDNQKQMFEARRELGDKFYKN